MISLGMNQPGWYCPSELDVTLIGQLFSSVRANLRFSVSPCVNASNVSDNDPNACAPQEEIENFIDISVWNIAWLANYFDEDEFEASPIKYNINLSYINSKMN